MPHTIELDSDRQRLAARIVSLREKKGWSQRELAIRLNSPSPSVVGHWEIGRQMPSLVMAARMAKAFGITLDELLEGVL